METNTTNTSPARRSARRIFAPTLLVAATALLPQGCTAARPAWSYNTEANPSPLPLILSGTP